MLLEMAWKGVTATTLGVLTTACGLTGHFLFAAPVTPVAMGVMSAPEPSAVSMADLTTAVGACITIVSLVLQAYFVQRAKKADIEREQRKKDDEAARDRKVEDHMADLKILVADALAKSQVHKAEGPHGPRYEGSIETFVVVAGSFE